ncbi:MAG: hypothetical protein ACIAQ0_00805 [Phycisphaerales bacterium JB058]
MFRIQLDTIRATGKVVVAFRASLTEPAALCRKIVDARPDGRFLLSISTHEEKGQHHNNNGQPDENRDRAKHAGSRKAEEAQQNANPEQEIGEQQPDQRGRADHLLVVLLNVGFIEAAPVRQSILKSRLGAMRLARSDRPIERAGPRVTLSSHFCSGSTSRTYNSLS